MRYVHAKILDIVHEIHKIGSLENNVEQNSKLQGTKECQWYLKNRSNHIYLQLSISVTDQNISQNMYGHVLVMELHWIQ
jgi:hypothetical protein